MKKFCLIVLFLSSALVAMQNQTIKNIKAIEKNYFHTQELKQD